MMFQPTNITTVKEGARAEADRDQELPQQLRILWDDEGGLDRIELTYAKISSMEPDLVRGSDGIQLFADSAAEKIRPFQEALTAFIKTWLASKENQEQRPKAEEEEED